MLLNWINDKGMKVTEAVHRFRAKNNPNYFDEQRVLFYVGAEMFDSEHYPHYIALGFIVVSWSKGSFFQILSFSVIKD